MKKFISIALAFILIIGLVPFNNVNAENGQVNNPEFLELLDDLINSEIEYGLSGAQIAAYKDGELIKNSSYGYINNYENVRDENGDIILGQHKVLPKDERTEVTNQTLFDMASNTKMFATVYALQKLVSENKISLDTKISDIFPEFLDYANENNWKESIDLKMVLSHRAGFAPDPQYHNNNYDLDDQIPNGKNDLFSQDKATTFEMIMKTPLNTEPDTEWAYSDVDMMLAGFIVEKITGQDLDTYVNENIYNPLGLDRITFNPLNRGFDINELSASELNGNTRDGRIDFDNVRKDIVKGEVHDEKAYYSMGGVSGHAGLFGTAEQVAYLAQAMLNDGTLNGVQLFDQETIDKFTEVSALATQTQGGWRRKSETGGAASWFSVFAPAGTIGHTGWTGTLSLIDKQNNLTLFINTNARNTPIMGPDANDFYNKNSNISSYGLVSELVYRSLGLADEKSVDDVLMDIIEAEITDVELANQLPSKRNVIRSLLDVLKNRSENSQELMDYLNSEKIQSIISELEKTYTQDVVNIKIIEEPEEETFTISFDANGGTINGESSLTIEAKEGETITIPSVDEREGYKFEYWEGSQYYPGEEYIVNGDHSFTAIWKEVETPGETDKETPGETDKETSKETKEETKQETKKENNPKNDKGKNPKTGDSGIGIYLIIALVSLSAIVFMKKSRKYE